MRRALHLWFFVHIFFSGFSQEQLVITDQTESVYLGLHSEVLSVAKNSSLSDVIRSTNWRKNHSKVFTLTQNNTEFWLRFKISNQSRFPVYYLQASCPYIDHFELYDSLEFNRLHSRIIGDKYPIEKREVKESFPIYELDLPPGESRMYYLKMYLTEDASFPVLIKSSENYYSNKTSRDFIYGLYLGLMLLIAAVNLIMYLMVKDTVYVKYSLYVLSVCLTQSSIFGNPLEYFYGSSTLIASNDFIVFPALVLLFGYEFFISYHNVSKGSFIYRFARSNQMLVLSGFLVFTLIDVQFLFDFYNLINLISSLFGLIASAYLAYKGSKLALIFLISWSTFLIGTIFFILQFYQIIHYSNLSNYAMPVGTALEAVFLSLAIGYRMKLMQHSSLVKDKLLKEQKSSNVQLAKKLGESRLKILRSQLNPHFMYNALSTIQNFIVSEDIKHASYYLSNFSGLMRMSMEQLDGNLLTIEKEIEFLENYFKIESVRFDHRFNYSIECDEDLDTIGILIPPFLIQPFAENAIKHAFKEKTEGPFIRVEIGYGHEEHRIRICIEDNGCGIDAEKRPLISTGIRHNKYGTEEEYIDTLLEDPASSYQAERGKHGYHSKGIYLVRRRLEILNGLYPEFEADMRITNKENECGLRIELDLPLIIYNYDQNSNY